MCIFLRHPVVTFGDVPNIALRAVIPGVFVYAFLPVFGWGPVTGGSGDKRPPISGDTDLQGGSRATQWSTQQQEKKKGKREKEGKEKGSREKERKREREKLQETTKKKQTQKHELTLREMQKKRKHQFWIDEETFHTKTVIKELTSQQPEELCAVGTRFNKK